MISKMLIHVSAHVDSLKFGYDSVPRLPGYIGYHMDLGQKAMKKPASKVAVKPVAKNRRDPNGSKWRIWGFI